MQTRLTDDRRITTQSMYILPCRTRPTAEISESCRGNNIDITTGIEKCSFEDLSLFTGNAMSPSIDVEDEWIMR